MNSGVEGSDLQKGDNRRLILAALIPLAAFVLQWTFWISLISDAEGRFIESDEVFVTLHKFSNKEECAKTFAQYPAFLDVLLLGGELAPLSQWAVPRAIQGETVTNVGTVVTGRDITARKQAEEAPRQTQTLLNRKANG